MAFLDKARNNFLVSSFPCSKERGKFFPVLPAVVTIHLITEEIPLWLKLIMIFCLKICSKCTFKRLWYHKGHVYVLPANSVFSYGAHFCLLFAVLKVVNFIEQSLFSTYSHWMIYSAMNLIPPSSSRSLKLSHVWKSRTVPCVCVSSMSSFHS